jgi:hypothetical protein
MFVSDVASRDAAALERVIQQNFERLQQSASARRQPTAHFTHIVSAPAHESPISHSVDDGTAADDAEDTRDAAESVQKEEEELLERQRKLKKDRSRRVVENEMRDADTRAVMEIKRVAWDMDDISLRARTLLKPVLADFVSNCVAWEGLSAPMVATMIDIWVAQWSARRHFVELHARTDLQPALADMVEAAQLRRMSGKADEEDEGMNEYLRISKSRSFYDKKRDVLKAFLMLKCSQLSQAQKLLTAMALGAEPLDEQALAAEQQRQEAEREMGIYVQSYLVSLAAWSAQASAEPAPYFRPPARARARHAGWDPILEAVVSACAPAAKAAPFACWDEGARAHLSELWASQEERARQIISTQRRKKDQSKSPVAYMLLHSKHFLSDMRRRVMEKVMWRDDLKIYVPARSPLLDV